MHLTWMQGVFLFYYDSTWDEKVNAYGQKSFITLL